ncbi:O-antigen polymerase [Chromohalobacter israelensis]
MRKYRPLDLLHPAAIFIIFYFVFILGSAMISTFYPLYSVHIEEEVIFMVIVYFFIFTASAYWLSPLLTPWKLRRVNKVEVHFAWLNCYFCASLVLFLTGLSFYFVVYHEMGGMPLLANGELENLRVEAKKGLGSYILLGNAFLILANILLYTIYRKVKKIKKVAILIITAASFLMIVGIGYRGPAAYLILYSILTYHFYSNQYACKQRLSMNYIALGIVLIVMVSFAGYLRHGGEFDWAGLLSVGWTFFVNLSNFNDIYQYFQEADFYFGMSFVNDFLVAFPDSKHDFLGNELKMLMGMEFDGEGVTVTAPGEGYVNFGFIGVIYHALFTGLVAGLVYNFLSQRQSNRFRVLLIIFSLFFSKVPAAGFMAAFVFTLAPMLIAYVFYVLVLKFIKMSMLTLKLMSKQSLLTS